MGVKSEEMNGSCGDMANSSVEVPKVVLSDLGGGAGAVDAWRGANREKGDWEWVWTRH